MFWWLIGRMAIGLNKYKYIRCDTTGAEERLHDLNASPDEMTYFEENGTYQETINCLKAAFEKDWFPGY